MVISKKEMIELLQTIRAAGERVVERENELLGALSALRSGNPACWCGMGIADPDLSDHTQGCKLAQAAYERRVL